MERPRSWSPWLQIPAALASWTLVDSTCPGFLFPAQTWHLLPQDPRLPREGWQAPTFIRNWDVQGSSAVFKPQQLRHEGPPSS
jgi:hypothetical protein